MQSGRLNYAFRLSTARLVILRLRFARRWHRLFKISSSSAHASSLRGLASLVILGVILGSAWLGYRVGKQTEVGPVALAVSRSQSPTANRQHDRRMSDATIPATEHPSTFTSVAAALSVVPAPSETERAEHQAEVARLAELASLRNTVGVLKAQVLALEQEASGLEVELLDQHMAFADAEKQWNQDSIERRIVYNITNIPVGGFVSEERIESDAELAEFPAPENDVNYQAEGIDEVADLYAQFKDIDGPSGSWNEDANLADVPDQQAMDANGNYEYQAVGAADQTGIETQGLDSSVELSSTSGLPNDSPMFQELFFGPAADRFEDWDNLQ